MNQSVTKALQLLELFTKEEQRELTLQDISIKADIPKPTAYRLLTTLEKGGFIYKTKESVHDSRYGLGLRLLELGQLVSERLELREVARPMMEELSKLINEAIHLVIVNQHKAIYIEKVDSTRTLRLNTRIGKTSPLYIGSGPKMLLAHLPKKQQEEVLKEDLYTFANNRKVHKKTILKELDLIRSNGYAYSEGEQDADTTGISYPVFDYQGEVIASLAVSGLSSYFEGERLREIKKETHKTASMISGKLGYLSNHVQ
ncbi:IclR family transcriptional regulator [Virgibacillus sp. W0181]|uniref:IclR family transcriptional regulator n=1 Tax=Virgibacillus sp. W0181 TaxID=3391581 RepID=UPI003F46CC3A